MRAKAVVTFKVTKYHAGIGHCTSGPQAESPFLLVFQQALQVLSDPERCRDVGCILRSLPVGMTACQPGEKTDGGAFCLCGTGRHLEHKRIVAQERWFSEVTSTINSSSPVAQPVARRIIHCLSTIQSQIEAAMVCAWKGNHKLARLLHVPQSPSAWLSATHMCNLCASAHIISMPALSEGGGGGSMQSEPPVSITGQQLSGQLHPTAFCYASFVH